MTRFRNLCIRAALFAAMVAAAQAALGQSAGASPEGGGDQSPSSSVSMDSAAPAEPGSPTSADPGDVYYRAGILVDWPGGTRFLDKSCASTSPAALYGCGDGNDGRPLGTYGDFDATPGLELGVGRIATSVLRLEGILSYRPNASFEGRANFRQTAGRQDVSAASSVLSAMLAAYLDLPALGLPRLGSLRPFVGTGGGLSRIDVDETRMEFPRTTTIVPGGHKVNLSWMLAAGFSAPLGKGTTIEIAWRYTDHGVVETGRGSGRIVWRDGSRAPLELDLAETRARLEGHGVAISLRHTF